MSTLLYFSSILLHNYNSLTSITLSEALIAHIHLLNNWMNQFTFLCGSDFVLEECLRLGFVTTISSQVIKRGEIYRDRGKVLIDNMLSFTEFLKVP